MGRGNWTDFTVEASNVVTLNQSRTHNDANEIGTITATTGTNWADPTHDAAGNMTAIPKPSSLANSYSLVYDAWNRLVEVKDGANTVAKYEYDGRNYRIVKSVYAGGVLDHDEHYYYNEDWQVLEVRRDAETTPHEQYFWHAYYIDALALRYWDRTNDNDFGDTDEVHYYTHDANFNVTAIADSGASIDERYAYSPYGEVRSSPVPSPMTPIRSATSAIRPCSRGGWSMPNTGSTTLGIGIMGRSSGGF